MSTRLLFLSFNMCVFYLLFLNWLGGTAEGLNKESEAEQKIIEKVRAVKVEQSELYDTFMYPIVIGSGEESFVYAEAEGRLSGYQVQIGDHVKKGDTVAVLERTEVGYSFKPIHLKSPIMGQVSQLFKKKGEKIIKGEKVVHILNPKVLDLKVEVPQKEITSLAKGLQGNLRINDGRETSMQVEIIGVSPMVDQLSGTSTVVLKIVGRSMKGKENLQVLPGSNGYVHFKINKRIGFSLPLEAIIHSKSTYMVRMIVEGKVVRKEVKLGRDLQDNRKEILTGIKNSDVVITSKSKYLRENEEVEPLF